MGLYDFVFYLIALWVTLSGIGVIALANPIYSALSLVSAMVGLASLFVMLEAHFIAAVQLIVYAGAVMVLFVMVLMLFDIKEEVRSFTKGVRGNLMKIAFGGLLCGLLGGIAINSSSLISRTNNSSDLPPMETTKELAVELFTRYLFAFEMIGVLLLAIAVGVVAVSRIRGGTHAKP